MTKNKKTKKILLTIRQPFLFGTPGFIKSSLVCGILLSAFLGFCLSQAPVFAQYYSTSSFASTPSGSSLIHGSAVSSDGSVHVLITSTPIETDQPLAFQITFADPKGNLIPYENYGITAQQMVGNGALLLSNMSALAVDGKDIQVTSALQNVSPVNIQVQLQGSGAPNTSISEWKGPNEILTITLGAKYASSTAASAAPKGTSQVVTIPFGAFNPKFNTAAPQWYEPSVVTIGVNQSVTWINQDKEVHTVTSGQSAGRGGLVYGTEGKPNGVFDSGNIPIGSSWTHKFTKPGTFEYFCTIHPWMQGYVIVKPSEAVPVDAYGNQITKFPVIRLTPDRRYEVDLDWEPHYIRTGEKVIFIYQVYDNYKDLAIPAHYVFTITQNGQQLYRVADSTQFGGAYQYFRFDKAGPVTFRFDDVANTGGSVQYTTVVNEGNSTTDMSMPIVEPARNLELNWWLMPLFFVPAGLASAGVYYLKLRNKRRDARGLVRDEEGVKTDEKKSPI
ncbi:MAG: hypothetical protein KGI33_04920 [Thaumarchaeota archaeon]|nr:hypothetical protein [Nitrososphaerota archaeon]